MQPAGSVGRAAPVNRFVVVAAPRSGTGYLARVLKRCGVACGHEDVYTPHVAVGVNRPWWGRWQGDVSWLAAPRLDDIPDDVTVFRQTRDPRHTAASMVATGMFDRVHRYGWLAAYQQAVLAVIPDLFDEPTPYARAERVRVEWNRLADSRAVMSWRVEDITVGMLSGVFDAPPHRARSALAATPTTYNTHGDRTA